MTELLRFDDDTAFRLADDAATVARIVRTTPAERLRERRFGEWSAIDALAHVTYLAEVTRERVRRCVAEDAPSIASVPSGASIDETDPMALGGRLRRAHGEIVRLLMAPSARERPATHPEMGRVNAGHFGAYHAQHCHEHVAELAAAFPPTL